MDIARVQRGGRGILCAGSQGDDAEQEQRGRRRQGERCALGCIAGCCGAKTAGKCGIPDPRLDADAAQYGETAKVWMSQVQPGYLKPGNGACMAVLALASKHGDIELATDVFRLLTDRETVFTTHHYELLISTHLKANDLEAALSVVLIMVDANFKVDAGTCQPLFEFLSTDGPNGENQPLTAFGMLQDFEAAGRRVPTAVVNACMQASIVQGRLEEAIEMYKALHTVSHSGPNTQTFNILFKGCHQRERKELAMYLANEMIQLGVKPDRITYDRLILVCLRSGDVEDALLYYQEMSSGDGNEGMKPRKRTYEILIYECAKRGDERAVAVLKDYKASVEEPRLSVEKAVAERFDYEMMASGGWSPKPPEGSIR